MEKTLKCQLPPFVSSEKLKAKAILSYTHISILTQAYVIRSFITVPVKIKLSYLIEQIKNFIMVDDYFSLI